MSDLSDVTRKLVAVFAADVEGYSRLMDADEVGTLKGLSKRRAILDRIIGDHRGRIANTTVSLRSLGARWMRCNARWKLRPRWPRLTPICRFELGDFFREIPRGADTLLLKSVIHDWDDKLSVVILGNCKASLPAHGRLMLIERIMPERAVLDPQHRSHAFSSLNMLRGPGGRERSATEYAALLRASGFELRKITPAGLFSVVEAFPQSRTRIGEILWSWRGVTRRWAWRACSIWALHLKADSAAPAAMSAKDCRLNRSMQHRR